MIGIDETAKAIVEHYGQPHQEVQAVQEMSELILLLAAREDQRNAGYTNRVAEEIADSLIMIEQIRIANGITDKDVNAWIAKKLSRQLNRIEVESHDQNH